MQDMAFEQVSINKLSHGLYIEKDVEVSVLRLDRIHPVISGNKWFKLKKYLQEARDQNKKTIVTFGGTYSNHIIATACACKMNLLRAIGIIRGEKPARLSSTLLQAEQYGMRLVFINRQQYKEKIIPEEIKEEHEIYVINEGGYGENGASGITDMLTQFSTKTYSHICCAVGTGTMMAGLIKAISSTEVIGISVLKGNKDAELGVRKLLNTKDKERNFRIIHDYHFGGFAKYTTALIDFMNYFYKCSDIPSDFVYTGKLFFSITDLIKNNFFAKGSGLLIIHSGGLQGNHSLPKGKLIF